MPQSLLSFDYHRNVTNRDFVHAFAHLPERQWTATSKRRWICARLGIFSPLISAGWNGYSIRAGVAYAEALSAYGQIQECQSVLRKLMYRPGIARYKAELIREFAKYNPSFAIEVIDSLALAERTLYHQALKSAIQYKQYAVDTVYGNCVKSTINYREQCQYFSNHVEYHPDLLLLNSNWLSNSAIETLNYFNQYQALYDLPPLRLKSLDYNNFNSLNVVADYPIRHHPLSLSVMSQPPHTTHDCTNNTLTELDTKVTIIVTVYNSENYLESTLHSLLNQSWRNLKIIVVDDDSTDNSLKIAKSIALADERLTVLSQRKNQGTYVAKNRALSLVTGSFVICHDADDWAHPFKIEQQVLPLLLNTELMATTSNWVKVDLKGRFFTRTGYPYKQKNPSSLLFRRQAIERLLQTDKSGSLWQPVRTGADSELFERFKLIFGKNSIKHIDKPLTLGGHHSDSLMNAAQTGTKNLTARIKRLTYWETWRRQHIEMLREGKI